MQAEQLLDQVSKTLQDARRATWSQEELLGYLNDGISVTCAYVPDACVTVASVALAAGMRQSLPADGLVLVDVTGNAGGGAMTQVSRQELARVQAGASPADIPVSGSTTGPAYFMYDRRAPKTFLVWPAIAQADVGQPVATVEMVYGVSPDPLTTVYQDIPLPAWANPALWAYVLFRAYAKNSKEGDVAKIQAYMAIHQDVVSKWLAARDRTVPQIDIAGES